MDRDPPRTSMWGSISIALGMCSWFAPAFAAAFISVAGVVCGIVGMARGNRFWALLGLVASGVGAAATFLTFWKLSA